MQKDLPIAFAAGAASAALAFLSPVGGVLTVAVFGYVFALPILLVGFSRGVRAAGLAALTAAALTGAAGPHIALMFALTYAFPAWVAVRIGLLTQVVKTDAHEARVWTPVGVFVTVLTLLAAVILLGALAISAGGDMSLAEKSRAIVRLSLSAMTPAGAETAAAGQGVEALALFFPGFAAANWMMMICFNTALALFILGKNGKSLRPSPRYAALALPDFMSWPLVGSAALALFLDGDAGFVFLNVTLVLAVPFFLQGTAVAHTLARRAPTPILFLGVFYVLMVSAYWMMATAALGMLEQWAGVRRRFAGTGGGNEETM